MTEGNFRGNNIPIPSQFLCEGLIHSHSHGNPMRLVGPAYMGFRLVPKSVTLNDLERRNGRYFAVCSPLLVSMRGILRAGINIAVTGFVPRYSQPLPSDLIIGYANLFTAQKHSASSSASARSCYCNDQSAVT